MGFKSIAVVGSGIADDETLALARDLGRLVARAGFAIICGGLGGVMEAACRGGKEVPGSVTVGILPGGDVSAANAFVDIPIPTGLGEARNTVVVSAATDGVVAIGGEFGTLSEIGFALKLRKYVVGLRTWELSKPGTLDAAIEVASTAEEAVELLLGKG